MPEMVNQQHFAPADYSEARISFLRGRFRPEAQL